MDIAQLSIIKDNDRIHDNIMWISKQLKGTWENDQGLIAMFYRIKEV